MYCTSFQWLCEGPQCPQAAVIVSTQRWLCEDDNVASFSPHLLHTLLLCAPVRVCAGVREVVLCKDKKGTIGLCVMSINKGVFVAMVQKDSPAAMAGMRFGDQILSVSGGEGRGGGGGGGGV